METKTSIQFTHSCSVSDNKNKKYFTVVKEKHLLLNKETEEVISFEDKLKIYEDISRTVYITKPQFRNHKYKKTTELKSKCDSYTIKDSEMIPSLLKILDDKDLNSLYRSRNYISLKEIFNSPYIYNADISAGSIIRSKYKEKQTSNKIFYTHGGLDIESCVDTGTVICNSVCYGNSIYQTLHEDWLWKFDNKGNKIKATVQDVVDLAYEKLGDILTKYNFKLNIKSFNSEAEVITKIFNKINKDKIDFIGSWSIYDFKHIKKRLEELGINPVDIFSSKDIPEKYRYLYIKEDKAKKSSIADKWDWVDCTSYTQYYNALAIYARKRAMEQKKPSYKLENIATEELGFGKMKTTSDDHNIMQKKHFVEYSVYNLLDTILIELMHRKNKDILTLVKLSDVSQLRDYCYQTITLRDSYNIYCNETGHVIAAVGKDMKTPYHDKFKLVGGSVLRASSVKDIGSYCIKERPNQESMVLILCGDEDFEAMYPRFLENFCIAKENKLTTVIGIEGFNDKESELFFGSIPDVMENASNIGKQFFNLPSYEEMGNMYRDFSKGS